VTCTPTLIDEAIEHHRCGLRESRFADLRRFGPEHPRPHAERRYSLSNSTAGKSTHNSNCLLCLEKNPWYQTRWKVQLDKLPQAERDEMLFMLAARWADDTLAQIKSTRHEDCTFS
jgi:hypothetical protein